MEQHEDSGNLKDLALVRLEHAEEDLKAAENNLSDNLYRAANNRAYYSIYHSITAVLALENKAFKKHKDTIGYFNQTYVKSNIFPRELGHRISIAKEIRHNSDYDDFYIVNKQETEKQIETAKLFLQAVKDFLLSK